MPRPPRRSVGGRRGTFLTADGTRRQQVAGEGRSKLPGQMERAIAALLTCRTHQEAARQAGIGERTLQRWLAEEPQFIAVLRAARRRLVETTIGRLQAISG